MGIFKGSGGGGEAARQAGMARKQQQSANEDAARSQQRSERTVGRGARGLLQGNIFKRLQATLGGAQ
jgi:hypothetical protein